MVEASLEKTGAMVLEASPEEIECELEHQEVPKEDTTVETMGALEDSYGDRHLAVGHCRQLKKWIQGDGGCQKKFSATHRCVTRHAVPAPRRIL
jgi:hypothetical protein